MFDIATEIRRAVDGVEPISAEEVVATAKRRRRRGGAGAGVALVAAVVITLAVVLSPGSTSKLHVGAPPMGSRPVTSSASAMGVTVRITFDTTTVVAGHTIAGELEIHNASGHRLVGKFCQNRSFGVQVDPTATPRRSPSYYSYSPGPGACRGKFIIPRGTSRWPITVNTTYRSQAGARQRYPLPAGRYREAFGFAPFTPITPPDPAPIRITVTAPHSAP